MTGTSLLLPAVLALPLAACSMLAPAPGAFISAAAVPSAIGTGVSAAPLPDGRAVAVGPGGLALYDPRTGRWVERSGPPGGGVPAGLAVLPDGTLFMLRSFQSGPDRRALRYRPAVDRWSSTAPMLELRTGPSLTLLQDGRVLVAGGFGVEDPSTPLTSAEIYDPSTDSWSATAPMLKRRFSPATTLLQDGRVLFAGGDENGSGVLAAEVYDPRANRWSDAGSLPFQAPRPITVRLRDGRVLLVAGMTFFQGPNPAVEIYDPRFNSWSPAPDAPSAGGGSVALLRDGRPLMLKIALTPNAALFRAEIFDPSTGAWSASPVQTGQARSAVPLKDGRVLVIGEGGGWIYDPAASPPPPPGQEGLGSPRLTLALAALAALLALVVLGQFVITRAFERRRPTPI